jgi:hypothetical protein
MKGARPFDFTIAVLLEPLPGLVSRPPALNQWPDDLDGIQETVGSSPGSLVRLFDVRLVSTDELNLLSPVLPSLQAFLEKPRALLEGLRPDLEKILPRLSELRDDLEESSEGIKQSSERRFRLESDRSGSTAVTGRLLHRLERQRPAVEA